VWASRFVSLRRRYCETDCFGEHGLGVVEHSVRVFWARTPRSRSFTGARRSCLIRRVGTRDIGVRGVCRRSGGLCRVAVGGVGGEKVELERHGRLRVERRALPIAIGLKPFRP
jgi:hypothetical protein